MSRYQFCILAFSGLLAGLTLAIPVLQAQEATPAGYRAYSLQHAQADAVAPKLREFLDGVAGQGEILIDRQANRLLLKGPDEAHRLAEEFLPMVDHPPAAASAAQGAGGRPVIRGYTVKPEELDAVAERLRQRYAETPGVRIVADNRTSQVIVAAPADQQADIARIVEPSGRKAAPENASSRDQAAPRLAPASAASAGLPSQPATPPARGARDGYQLQHSSWQDFEDSLRRIWGERLALETERNGELANVILPTTEGRRTVMTIDRRRDQIAFDVERPDADAWWQVARALDAPRLTANESTQVVPQGKADPARVYQAVSLLKALGGEAGANDAAEALPGPGGSRAAWGGKLISMLFQQADGQPAAPPQPGPPGPDLPPPVDPDAPDVPGAEDQAATIGPVRIEYIEGLGVFVVRGNRRDVARVVELIEQIRQRSDETQPVVEVRRLRFANSLAIAALIDELYEEVYEPRQSPVSVTALDKPNAILLIGQRESVASILELIEKLDTPADPNTQLKLFPLQHASAIDAETTVRNFFVDRPGAGDELRPGLGTRVRVIADYRTNSLIVQASPRDMAEIAELLKKLDVENSEADMELRVFRLKNALASDLVPVLVEAITGTPTEQQQALAGGQPGVGVTRPQTTRRSTNVSILSVDTAGNRLIQSGILSDMVITADPNVNALVVRGPSSGMDLMAELIRQLDQLPEAEAQIKVFELENGDATTLTALLQELFGLPITAGQGTLGQAFNVQRQNIQSLTGGGESSLVPLRFSVDVRTNSIVATGSRGDLNVVEVLLLRLDEGGIESRKTEVYFLQNAPAIDVANAIRTFLDNQRAITQQLFLYQAVTPFEQIDREVIVVPEPISNSLIVSATPRYYDAVRRIIRDLDYKPPMVLVQVVLATVSLDDAFEFGVELGLQDSLLFDRGREGTEAVPPLGFNFNRTDAALGNDDTPIANATRELLAGQALSNLMLGRQSANFGYGGLVLSAANESVNILVRALQDQGRLQVLARPQVMTLDNEEAFVQIGQDVPRITGSQVTPQGGTATTVEDVPVGLILRIRPRVNQEDVVVMTVDTTRSEIDPTQSIPTGLGASSPVIDTITAQTTLSARSGQTVVFAGLITSRRSVDTRRVPYLSDIPILGRLFRFDSTTNSREELLIFLTPHIVRSDADIDRLKYIESDRMSWCLADLVEMHGPAGLSGGHGLWNPPATPTIYPFEDPTGGAGLPMASGVPTPAAPLETVPTPQPLGPAAPGPALGPDPPMQPPLPPLNSTSRRAPLPTARPAAPYGPQRPLPQSAGGEAVAAAAYQAVPPERLPATPYAQ